MLFRSVRAIALNEYLKEQKAAYEKDNKEWTDHAKNLLKQLEDRCQPANGMIVKCEEKLVGKGFIGTKYQWYPNRKAPDEEVKGLTRLKGHLKQGQYLTKFRKVFRKDALNQDLVLLAVPDAKVQSYARIMPTSPP